MRPPRGRPPQGQATDRPFRVAGDRPWENPRRLLVLIPLAVVATELIVMLLLPRLPQIGVLTTAILNAAVLAAVLTPLLWRFVYRPFSQHIRERDEMLRSLSESEWRFRDIVESAHEWIWEVDSTGRYTYSSPVVTQILGYTPEEILQMHFYDLFHPDEREVLKQEAFRVFSSRQPFQEFLNRNRHKDGRSVWLSTNGIPLVDAAGGLRGYRGTDIVKHDESAMTDALTGVLNRHGFLLLAEQQLKMAVRNRIPAALLFADLDHLKTINDRHGHAEGDQALARVAAAIRASMRESDIVARFGGDEFVVLLTGVTEKDVEQVVLGHLHERLATHNTAPDRHYDLSVSSGVALYDPENPCTLQELIQQADESMYRHKRHGHQP